MHAQVQTKIKSESVNKNVQCFPYSKLCGIGFRRPFFPL